MKKILLATTAVAAFVAFSGTAQAQDPGRPDFGATEGGGGAGSAFTVKTNGAVKFYLKYATGDKSLNEDKGSNSGLFTLINAELEINGAATTDNGTDVSTHIDFNFSGNAADSSSTTGTANFGGSEQTINLSNFAVIDELSMKIGGGWGSVEMGGNDGAEDILKTYGGTVGAGTGGVDGDYHSVDGGVGGNSVGGTAGGGDSGDALKVTYMSPNVAGFQAGLSLNYVTDGPDDIDGGTLGVGVGAKYAGSAGGFGYAISVVWGDTALTGSQNVGEARAAAKATALTGLNDAFLAAIEVKDVAVDATARLTEGAGDSSAVTTIRTAVETYRTADGTLTDANAQVVGTGTGEVTQAAKNTAITDAKAALTAAKAALTALDVGKVSVVDAVIADVDAGKAVDAAVADIAAKEGVDDAGNAAAKSTHDADFGGLGIGVKLSGAGVTGVVGVTIDGLGRNEEAFGVGKTGFDLHLSPGISYAIPGGKANVSVTAALSMPHGIGGNDERTGKTEASNYFSSYIAFLSGDYTILPGVTLAVDLGYGDSDIADEMTKSAGFTGLVRAKAAF